MWFYNFILKLKNNTKNLTIKLNLFFNKKKIELKKSDEENLTYTIELRSKLLFKNGTYTLKIPHSLDGFVKITIWFNIVFTIYLIWM